MKTIFNKTFFYGTLVALFASSCTSDDDKATPNDNRVAVRVSAGVQTRAVNDVWNENDAIGISMIDPKSGTILTPYANYDYTTAGDGNFSPAQGDKIIYLPADGMEVSFKAYYPFSADTPANHILPVSVNNQTSQADIDLMTAEHVSGTSINDPNVKLHFYHRLAKVLVDLTTDETGLIDLKDCKLTIKGLKTKASYDLMKEAISIDDASVADINVPIHNSKGEAIWLPRAAGEGITFEVTTADGGTYTAKMDAALELKAGYKHTFHIRLKSTPVTVNATIEEWTEGPERKTDVIRLTTGLKDSKDFQKDDTLRLFLKDKAQENFGYISTFKYGSDGKWSTPTLTYWESITANPASFRGATIIARKLNDTQMDDILASKDIEVAQYTGVNLEMRHIGSKVIIELKSTDGTFSANDLKNATVVLPGYLTGGSIDLKTGSFIPGNDKTDIKPEGGIAIFPPQTIANGKLIAQITINGRTYDVEATETDGFGYKTGVANKLTMDLHKSKVEMSAVITPWTEETHEFQDIRIAAAALGSNGGDLLDGDKLYIYTGNSENRIQKGEHFLYNKGTNNWTYSNSSTPLYWEDIAVTDDIYGFIEHKPISNSTNANQLPDYIVTPTPVANGGGATNTALHLQMEHAVAKVIVILQSKTFSLNELIASEVILPNYTTGGIMDKGLFIPGTIQADIKLDKLKEDTPKNYIIDAAYLQAQDIEAGRTVVKVTLNGRTYEAKKENEVIKYEAGKATTLIVNLEKTGIAVSASVTGWDKLPEVNFNDALFFEVKNPESSGFTDGDKITMYQINSSSKVEKQNDTYSYSNKTITATTPWYRNDFVTDDKISAVYPNSPIAGNGSDSFAWTCGGGNDHNKDVLVATNGIIKDGDSQVELGFKHVLSKVTVNICAGEGFTVNELKECDVTINDVIKNGTINVVNGQAIVASTGATTGNLSATKLNTAHTVDGKTVASSYETFIMPQTITAAQDSKKTLVTVTLALNGKKQSYNAEIKADVTFEGGKNHIYNITLAKTGLSFKATVADWSDGTGGDITIN